MLPPLLAVIFGCVLAGIVMVVVDAEGPVGATRTVWVNGVEDGASPASIEDVDEAVSQFAVDEGVAVARVRNDPTVSASARTLYAAEPPIGVRVPRTAFSPAVEQSVAGLSEDPQSDPRTFYAVFGDDEDRLRGLFSELGYRSQSYPSLWHVQTLVFALGGYVAPIAGLIILLLVALTLALSLSSTRRFAVADLHGQTPLRMAADVVLTAARPTALGMATISILVTVFLFAMNGGADIGLYALTALLFSAALLVVVACSLLAGVFLATARGVREGLAGRRDTMSAVGVIAAVNVLALVALVTVAVSVVLLTGDLRRASETRPADAELTYTMLSGSTTSDMPTVERLVGQTLRAAAARGEVIVADPGHDSAPPIDMPGGPATVLLVNDTYFDRHPDLADAVGGIPDTSDTVHVYVPTERAADAAAITDTASQRLLFDAERTGTVLPPITTATVPGRTWPIYPDINGLNRRAEVVDPIVVVLTRDLRPLADDTLVAALSQSRVLFTSHDLGQAAVDDGGLSPYVHSVVTAGQAQVETQRRVFQELVQQWGAVVAALIVLGITALSLATCWCQARQQRLFNQWVHGWHWGMRHGPVLAIWVIATVALVTGWIILVAPDTSSVLPPGDADRAAVRTLVGAGAVAVSIGVFTVALATTSARNDHRPGGHS